MGKVHTVVIYLDEEDWNYARDIKRWAKMDWAELFITALKRAFGEPGEEEQEVKKPTRKCPGCGREIPEDAKICPYCGISLESGGFSILPGL